MLYVLDLDDTIYLERDYIYSGFCCIDSWLREKRNIHGFFENAWGLFEQDVRENIFDIVLKELKIFNKDLVQFLIILYRSHLPDIEVMPDVMDFFIKKKKRELALITDGYSISQHKKISSLQLKKYIDTIIVTDDWGREFWKPHHRAYLEVQKGFSPEQCIYIGDNPFKDFIIPYKLGWAQSIRIRRENSLHYNIETPKNCHEVGKLTEIKF
jgi:putative hydrolase of the HAD superfamily